MIKLTDEDPCPVKGEHLGTKMGEVPASFLDWVVGKGWSDRKYPAVVQYVKDNRELIDRELIEQGKL